MDLLIVLLVFLVFIALIMLEEENLKRYNELKRKFNRLNRKYDVLVFNLYNRGVLNERNEKYKKSQQIRGKK